MAEDDRCAAVARRADVRAEDRADFGNAKESRGSRPCNPRPDFIVKRKRQRFRVARHLLHRRNGAASSSALLESQPAYLANLRPAIDSRANRGSAARHLVGRLSAGNAAICSPREL